MRRAHLIMLLLIACEWSWAASSTAFAASSSRSRKERNGKDIRGLGLASVDLATTLGQARAPGSTSATQQVPPVGARRYVVDPKNTTGPIRIEGMGSGQAGAFMKDPRQPGEIPPPVASAPRPHTPAKPVAMRPAQLRFQRMPINGKMTRPRVAFSRDLLPLQRADEPVQADFFQKVYQPIEDNEF